ncbi:MAG: transposase [Deltaproteobacteria bacterium]|nr:transposase [Deltaproteobacteria bacterium]
MNDKNFFLRPTSEWQRRYEALRASFVERLPAKAVADRYGYSQSYVNLLRHQFIHEKIDFNEPPPTTDKSKRRRVDSVTRSKICNWREQHLSAGEITQLLSEDGVEISIRTVERILTEEGYPKLPRRTRLKIGITTKGAEVPASSEPIAISQLSKRSLDCEIGGVFLFAPFIEKLNIHQVLKEARLPESKLIPALNYFLSFLALKLIGTERYSHTGDHSFDAGLGLFTGLNVIPKCTAMSTYSYSLDPVHLLRLQKGFVKQASKLGLYNKHIINLDFHTVPHFGEDSELETHWAGARNKRMKGALTLFAQDADSKLILYTGADIRRDEADDQVLQFLSFWKSVQKGVKPTLIFDSKFTTYTNLSVLNAQGIKFITLRRRGKNLLDQVSSLKPWKRINIPHDKRKYPNPYVYESLITLKGYQGELRQIVMKGNGHENPAFLISNDLESPVELLVSNYSRRWRVENVISESMKFFSLNALPSPILTKVHFDVVMTMIADTLYSMLADKLRGFEDCDAPKVFRHFVRGKAKVKVNTNNITVTYPRRAHNPILRAVPWHRLPTNISWLENCQLNLKFK